MKVIIAGGRRYRFTQHNISALNRLKDSIPITEVVCGMAQGADLSAKRWAEQHGIPVKEFPAEWENFDLPVVIRKWQSGREYNAYAGIYRNQQMADYGDVLIAFPGKKGTKNMVEEATKRNLIIYNFMEKK